MKVAFIYTGAMRSFDRCLANHRWMIHRHFPEAKFYVVTEDDEDAHKAELLNGAISRKLKQPEMIIPAGCPDEWTKGQPYMHEPYAISVDPRAVLGQLWTLREGWRLYEEANDPAHLVIRIRPDIWFHSFEIPTPVWESQRNDYAALPWWGHFGGCNDRFALLKPTAAKLYFETYDRIPMLMKHGCPLHPESLVNYSMRFAGCSINNRMRTEFSTVRKNGEVRPPEIFSWDLAHCGLRPF